ncbi:Sulfopropanediol 3-dehydrogenase [Baekduia alba]|uniref:histidinol dehydrogenase n=1 Tax=Baekduia alba TaxID=2997333 RepID=UPI0023428123|nr:histidinol dehydrogenase [Baekduia alba]WCB96788.1 Sulfopropanediol 3-dehydrogenase [Baekduia alba]
MSAPLLLKSPTAEAASGPDAAVAARVSEMLLRIEREGVDALRAYSRELDDWDPPSFEVTDADVATATASLPEPLRASIAFAQSQIGGFAELQRATLTDFEAETLPGVFLGQKQVPVASVGAYCPSGRVPMLACAFMTVLVPKVAGVEQVVACTPPRGGAGVHAPTLHAIATSGADRIFALGGVQALAAMAFGLLDGVEPVDVIVGPGNAFVAEAKRQLFGRVGIDLLAGPSEVAVIADETADAELVAADLLAQAEHGPSSPAVLITTSEAFGRAVIEEVGAQLDALAAAGADDTSRRAWTDHGTVMVASDREHAVELSDAVATEHLEVQTVDDDWYFARLRNYGSIFLGGRATVAFSDKAIGTNHTLPTGRAARYTGGLSVAKFLKTLTYQRIDTDDGVRAIAPHVAEIARADLMPAHEATATKRLARLT